MTEAGSKAMRRQAVPRRGLSQLEAAVYVGVSPAKFVELVADGRMPVARRIDDLARWDIEELDIFFSALPPDQRTGSERAGNLRKRAPAAGNA